VLVLELPHEPTIAALRPLLPILLSYLLSFLYVAIYWNNHHHLLHAAEHVSGGVLWANMHLLFWLSLIPFVTRWMGTNRFAPVPTAFYGGVLLLSALAYWVLVHTIVASESDNSVLTRAIGDDVKGTVSIACYAVAIGAAFFRPWIAGALYGLVALIWLVPDRRIERALAERRAPGRRASS
jgi:uncharacterized membrane protein